MSKECQPAEDVRTEIINPVFRKVYLDALNSAKVQRAQKVSPVLAERAMITAVDQA